MKTEVSILMGIYNCADTLAEAIDSILNQTFRDWELILCDDGSQDDTYVIAEKYQIEYPERIILLKNEKNLGLNLTLNRCLELASGRYIARMDGDDISCPNRLETETAFLNAHKEYAVVSCPMVYFDDAGEWQMGNPLCAEPEARMLVHGTVHCHAPCMIRSEVIRAVGGYSVDKKLMRVEDWHLWVKVYAAGYRGYNLQTPLYRMRDDRNAIHRRRFRYRLNEAYVSAAAVSTFELPLWNYLYSLRPILVGLLPLRLYSLLHRGKMKLIAK